MFITYKMVMDKFRGSGLYRDKVSEFTQEQTNLIFDTLQFVLTLIKELEDSRPLGARVMQKTGGQIEVVLVVQNGTSIIGYIETALDILKINTISYVMLKTQYWKLFVERGQTYEEIYAEYGKRMKASFSA